MSQYEQDDYNYQEPSYFYECPDCHGECYEEETGKCCNTCRGKGEVRKSE